MKKLFIPLVGLVAVACNSGSGTDSTTTTTGTTTPEATTGTAPAATTGATAATGAATFATVASVAGTNCMPCHSAKSHAGGLSLASYADLMKGGQDGVVVKAGDPDGSLLVKVLKGPVDTPKIPQMPMKRPPLTADQIQTVSDWIKAGAKES